MHHLQQIASETNTRGYVIYYLSKSIVQLILIIDDVESSNIQNNTIDFVIMM